MLRITETAKTIFDMRTDELAAAIEAALRHRGTVTVALARLDDDLGSVIDHETGTVYIDDREPVRETLAEAVHHLAPRLHVVPRAVGEHEPSTHQIPLQTVTSATRQRRPRQRPLPEWVRSETTSDDGR